MKTPLVLLHGWGVNSQIWNPILPALKPVFDVHVLNLPGYGAAVDQVADDFEYDLPSVVQHVLAAAPETAIWVGWSLGATIAMAAALSAPDRLSKLLLISPTPKFMNEPASDSNQHSDVKWEIGMEPVPMDALARSFESSYSKGLKKFLLLQFSHCSNMKDLVRAASQQISKLKPPTSGTLCDSLNLLAAVDLREQIPNLQIETQIVAGRHDRVIPHSASQWLADNLPRAEITLLESGHLPFIDAPDSFLASLLSFAGNTEK